MDRNVKQVKRTFLFSRLSVVGLHITTYRHRLVREMASNSIKIYKIVAVRRPRPSNCPLLLHEGREHRKCCSLQAMRAPRLPNSDVGVPGLTTVENTRGSIKFIAGNWHGVKRQNKNL